MYVQGIHHKTEKEEKRKEFQLVTVKIWLDMLKERVYKKCPFMIFVIHVLKKKLGFFG